MIVAIIITVLIAITVIIVIIGSTLRIAISNNSNGILNFRLFGLWLLRNYMDTHAHTHTHTHILFNPNKLRIYFGESLGLRK